MKISSRILCLCLLILGCLMAGIAAAEDLSVLKIDTMVTEKGSDTYSLSVKAFVKNLGPADDVTINVVAIDASGFELHNATLSGSLAEGQTKVLVGIVKMPKTVYDQVIKWEWKK